VSDLLRQFWPELQTCRANYQLTSVCCSGYLNPILIPLNLPHSLNLVWSRLCDVQLFSSRFVDKHYRWLDNVVSRSHLHLHNPLTIILMPNCSN